MPKRSSTSRGATYLDRERRVSDLRESAQRAAAAHPEICRVILFGSLAHGIPTPRSDADLLIELTSSPHLHPRDRIPQLLGELSPLPCPVDLFIFTTREMEQLSATRSPIVVRALANGIELYRR